MHCHAGISRSASTVVAYMMYTRKITVDEAYTLVSAKRPCINPNDGFVAQLRLFESELKEQGFIN